MWKISYLKNIDVWWRSDNVIPERHIEDVFDSWYAFPEDGSWTRPDFKGENYKSFTLYQNDKTGIMPDYIKLQDDNNELNTLYYFKSGVGSFYNIHTNTWNIQYILDEKMTYHWFNLKKLKDINPKITHLSGFRDPYGYTLKEDGSYDININFWNNQIWYNNISESSQLIKEKTFSTNNYEILSLNELQHDYIQYDQLHSNNKYLYLVGSSSAHIKVLVDEYGENPKQVNLTSQNIIIYNPDINRTDGKNELEAIQRVDVTNPNSTFDILGDGTLFKAYYSDVPPSVVMSVCKNDPKSGFILHTDGRIAYKDDDGSSVSIEGIKYFEIDSKYLVRFKLRHFDILQSNTDALESRIYNIVKLGENLKWNIYNEPTLLHPQRFYETIQYEDASKIKYDISHINYTGNTADISSLESLDLYVNLTFSNGETLFYDFGDNFNYNNPYLNNTNSNLRMENPCTASVYGSNAANYYSQSATAGWTAVANTNASNVNAGVNYGFDALSSTTGLAKKEGFKWLHPIESIENDIYGAIDTAADIARGAVNLAYKIHNNNRNLQQTINNTMSGATTAVSNPFIGSYAINKGISDDKPLFVTYTYKLPEMIAESRLLSTLNEGYLLNIIGDFMDYDNRKWMNIIHVNAHENQAVYLDILKSSSEKNWMFYNESYFISTLNLISSQLKEWKVRPNIELLYENVPKFLPLMPIFKPDLWTLFDNFNVDILYENELYFSEDCKDSHAYNYIIHNNIKLTPEILEHVRVSWDENNRGYWFEASEVSTYTGKVFVKINTVREGYWIGIRYSDTNIPKSQAPDYCLLFLDLPSTKNVSINVPELPGNQTINIFKLKHDGNFTYEYVNVYWQGEINDTKCIYLWTGDDKDYLDGVGSMRNLMFYDATTWNYIIPAGRYYIYDSYYPFNKIDKRVIIWTDRFLNIETSRMLDDSGIYMCLLGTDGGGRASLLAPIDISGDSITGNMYIFTVEDDLKTNINLPCLNQGWIGVYPYSTHNDAAYYFYKVSPSNYMNFTQIGPNTTMYPVVNMNLLAGGFTDKTSKIRLGRNYPSGADQAFCRTLNIDASYYYGKFTLQMDQTHNGDIKYVNFTNFTDTNVEDFIFYVYSEYAYVNFTLNITANKPGGHVEFTGNARPTHYTLPSGWTSN